MHNFVRIAVIVALLVFCAASRLQAQPENLPTDNYVPPSPEASALGKYVSIPVGLYTGTPEINLPLWNLTEGGLSVPVSLSYHASSNKVDEIASRVGLGWVLNAGGVISRTVVGQPDEFGTYSYLNLTKTFTPEMMKAENLNDEDQFDLWENITRHCWDMEPDQFIFNFNGITGKFGFEWNSDKDNSILIASENKVRIEPIGLPATSPAGYIQGWKVTDQNGTVYKFEARELTKFKPLEGSNEDPDDLFNDCYDRASTPTSWYLTEIISTNGEWIHFAYNDYSYSYHLLASESLKPMMTSSDPGPIKIRKASVQINGKNLGVITTSSGQTTINFVESSGQARTDLPATILGTPNNLKPLSQILVKDVKGQTIKEFGMNHTYETGRLTLKALLELSGDNQSGWKPSHVFDYDATMLPPFPSKIVTLPGVGTIDIGSFVGIYTQDHWGYYNSNPNQTLIPMEGAAGMADRSPDPVRMKAGILRKIHYPTGGTTTFEFEPHTYSAIGTQQLNDERMGGGVRIKRITDHDGAGVPMVRAYEYKLENQLSSGSIAQFPNYKFYGLLIVPLGEYGTYVSAVGLYTSNSLVTLAMTKGSYIGYREVTEYHGQSNEGGKSTSYFTSFYSHNDDYSNIPFSEQYNVYFQPYPPPESYESSRGLLTKQVDFKYETGAWAPVRESTFEYYFNSAFALAFKAGEYLPGMFSSNDLGDNSAEALIGISFYKYRFGFSKLKKSVETIIENGQPFSTYKTYEYNTNPSANVTEKFNSENRFVTRVTANSSANKVVSTEYSYPFQYGNYFPHAQFKDRHMLSPVIETIVTESSPGGENAKVVGGSFTVFQSFGNNILPAYQYRLLAAQPVVDLLQSRSHNLGHADGRYYTPTTYFVNYTTSGKPVQVNATTDLNSVLDDEITSYIYDNSSHQLLATVTNGMHVSSAFTDFENGIHEGGWYFSDWLPNFSNDAHTGLFAFSGELNSKSVPAGTYAVSLWAKGSGEVVVQGVPRQVNNQWKRYEWIVSLSATSSISVVTNGTLIDGLRLHPQHAQMKTFTYRRLVGVTSETDENHTTIHYEYDGFGRLKTLRDQDKNIIKHYQYNYK